MKVTLRNGEEIDVHIAVVSHQRANKSFSLAKRHGYDTATVYVREDQVEDYKKAGWVNVRVGGRLCPSKNIALLDAESEMKWCLILSDDITKFSKIITRGTKHFYEFTSFRVLLKEIASRMVEFDCKLGGLPPVNNPLFYNPENKNVFTRFIIGDFNLIRPGSNIRFDEGMKLKEDYDFTIQFLKKFGRVLRCEDLAMEVEHYTAGGVFDDRKLGLEKEMCDYMVAKHGDCVRLNPKRENEIILSFKK